MKKYAILPILAGFFVMGFSDIIGTVMNQVKVECALSDAMAGFLPSMIFIWFLLISVPTGVACGKWGRRNMTLVSLVATAAAMFLALAANAERFWIYFIVFALLGIGNTVIQAALPALLSNVVPQDQLTSRISLGQFVKAICAALTPVFVYLTATALGNWKLLFPLYGLITVACALWLFLADIPAERANKAQDAARPSFLVSLRLLGDGYVLAMVGGIFFSVAADVGFNVAIPDFLKGIYKMDVDKAGMGPTIYFIAKTLGAFLGALVFAKVSPARCFPWSVALALAGTAGIFFAPTCAPASRTTTTGTAPRRMTLSCSTTSIPWCGRLCWRRSRTTFRAFAAPMPALRRLPSPRRTCLLRCACSATRRSTLPTWARTRCGPRRCGARRGASSCYTIPREATTSCCARSGTRRSTSTSPTPAR